MSNKDYRTRTLNTPDGVTITTFDGKLHNWDGPALVYPKDSKTKPEYYLYGIQYTKDEWLEIKRDRNRVASDKIL